MTTITSFWLETCTSDLLNCSRERIGPFYAKKKVPTAVLIRMQGDQKRESVSMIKEYLKGDEGSFLKQKEISVNNPDRLHLLKMYLVSKLFFHLKDTTNNNQRI